MSKVEMIKEWVLTVNQEELRLIHRALGGRMDSREEAELAKALDRKLALNRIAFVEQLARETDKLKSSLQNS